MLAQAHFTYLIEINYKIRENTFVLKNVSVMLAVKFYEYNNSQS